MSELPYSYHTFLFPFIWKTSEDQDLSKFKRILSVGKQWIETSWKEGENPEDENTAVWCQNYQAYQYFTDATNDAVFGTRGDHVVECFTYRPNGKSFSEVNGRYIIRKEEKTYTLRINGINLYIYEVGTALLCFELENFAARTLDDVNKINEYGRRVNFPFLVSDMTHPVCADCIQIWFDDELFDEENYRMTSKNIKTNAIDYLKEHISQSYIMSPVQKILDNDGTDNGGYSVTAHIAHKNSNTFYIKPCIDDRMFVCCLVRDDDYSKKIKEFNADDNDYRIFSDCYKKAGEEDLSEQIYKLFFIEKDCTCQSRTMRKDILKESLYTRWIDCGTLYGVTHHSIVCLTSRYEGIIASVINPFLTIYVRMAIIMLIQRATILLFEDEAAKISGSFSDNHEISSEQLRNIEILQARYVKAQNQLFLSELTAQEQGVEIHEMFRKQLYVEKNMTDLNAEINNLRDIANIANERMERHNEKKEEEREKKIEALASAAGIIIGAASLAEPVASVLDSWYWLAWTVVFGAIGWVIWKIYKKKIRRE